MAIDSPPRPPSQDELDALIPEARNRHRRRQLLSAVAIAVAAALALSVYAVAAGGGFLGTIGYTLGLTAAPTCHSSQLRTEPVLFTGVLIQGGGIGITNTS